MDILNVVQNARKKNSLTHIIPEVVVMLENRLRDQINFKPFASNWTAWVDTKDLEKISGEVVSLDQMKRLAEILKENNYFPSSVDVKYEAPKELQMSFLEAKITIHVIYDLLEVN